MPTTVTLPDGRRVTVQTDDPEKAKEAVLKFLAQQGPSRSAPSPVSPGPVTAETLTDFENPLGGDPNFDYETGVDLKGLRTILGFFENDKEKDDYLVPLVGSKGFVRDNAGNLALTPTGLKRVGITPQDDRNVVIDESGMSWGDVADMSGIVGPVVGMISAATPYGRGAKFLGEIMRMGTGAAAGKGAEELGESIAGVQRQTPGELGKLFGTEFALGAGAQAVVGTLGVFLKSLLGAKVPKEEMDRVWQIAKGTTDPLKKRALAESLGREPTESELRRAGAYIEGAPHQKALGRAIPSRIQAAKETILGRQAKDARNISYLNAEAMNILERMGAEDLMLTEIRNLTPLGKQAQEAFIKKLQELRKSKGVTDANLDKVVQKTVDDIERGLFSGKSADTDVAKVLRETLFGETGLYTASRANIVKMYDDVDFSLAIGKAGDDESLTFFRNVRDYTDNYERQFNEVLSEAITRLGYQPGRTMAPEVENFINAEMKKRGLKSFSELLDGPTPGFSIKIAEDGIKLNPTFWETQGYGRVPQLAIIPTGVLRNSAKQLAEESNIRILGTQAEGLNTLAKLSTKFDPRRPAAGGLPEFMTFKELHNLRIQLAATARGSPNTILKDLDTVQATELKKTIDGMFDTLRTGDTSVAVDIHFPKLLKELDPEGWATNPALANAGKFYGEGTIQKAVQMLDTADLAYVKHAGRWDKVIESAIVRDAKNKTLDFDMLYVHMRKKDRGDFWDRFWDRIEDSAQAGELQAGMMNQWFRSMAGKHTDPVTKLMDPKAIMREWRALGTTANSVFGKEGSKQMGAIVHSLGSLRDDVPYEQALALARSDKTSPQIMQAIAKIKQAQNEVAAFEGQALVRALTNPRTSPEEVVSIVFKPGNADLITKASELLPAETMTGIRQEAMREMLRKSVGAGDNVEKVFKSRVLEDAMKRYGDDTLRAMFGNEHVAALKEFTAQMRTITQAEGMGAGNIVAGAIALNAFNILNLMTIGQIGVIGHLLSQPAVIRSLAKTDPTSIRLVTRAIRQAMQYAAAKGMLEVGQDVGGGLEETTQDIQSETMQQLQQNPQIMEEVRGVGRQLPQGLPGLRGQLQGMQTSSIAVPDVQPPQTGTPIANPIVLPDLQDQFLAERLGRV